MPEWLKTIPTVSMVTGCGGGGWQHSGAALEQLRVAAGWPQAHPSPSALSVLWQGVPPKGRYGETCAHAHGRASLPVSAVWEEVQC